ncbi:MAG: serine acetyltransferase [Acidimicrobiales bacterium]|jgi:serine O-acetyltransferase
MFARQALKAAKRASLEPLVEVYQHLKNASIIDQDMAQWKLKRPTRATEGGDLLVELMLRFPEFRNVFYCRLDRMNMSAVAIIAKRIWRPVPTMSLDCCPEIGPGLVITHGFNTILNAERIGRNCWAHHEVTLGWNYGSGCPTIGDDVFIGAGAKVLGKIVIGDGARIGANAVVVHDVPPGATAVGVPARVIARP